MNKDSVLLPHAWKFQVSRFPRIEENRDVYIPHMVQMERMLFLSRTLVHYDNSTHFFFLLSFSHVKLIQSMVLRVMDLFLFILGFLSLLITRPPLSNVTEECCIESSYILYLKHSISTKKKIKRKRYQNPSKAESKTKHCSFSN